MKVEADLKKELKRKQTPVEQQQIDAFEKFQDELRNAGYEIRRERFSIALMERVGLGLPPPRIS